MSDLKSVLHKVTITQIPENALLDSVIKELNGREMFIDADDTLGERMYAGDVFEAIASELAETDNYSLKLMAQLDELAMLIDTEYVQITMI